MGIHVCVGRCGTSLVFIKYLIRQKIPFDKKKAQHAPQESDECLERVSKHAGEYPWFSSSTDARVVDQFLLPQSEIQHPIFTADIKNGNLFLVIRFHPVKRAVKTGWESAVYELWRHREIWVVPFVYEYPLCKFWTIWCAVQCVHQLSIHIWLRTTFGFIQVLFSTVFEFIVDERVDFTVFCHLRSVLRGKFTLPGEYQWPWSPLFYVCDVHRKYREK